MAVKQSDKCNEPISKREHAKFVASNGRRNPAPWRWLLTDMHLKEAILCDAKLPGRLKCKLWREFSDNEKKAINAALKKHMPDYEFID